VDISKPVAESAEIVIAEVNPNMPRTLGDSFIHIDEIDTLVESNAPLLEVEPTKPDEVSFRIAENVAELIEDGSTLQMGIGLVPEAVLPYLKHKKDLGVHTELFSDAIIDLVEAGVITCRKKNLHPGKVVASFCMGTRRLYDFVDNNPLFEFHPSDYTNDPFIISQNDRMVSVNAALEVDLTGQVCADSVGYYFYSGIGGHLDFTRGAAHSEGGKPIIVLPSTTRDGTKSRIVPHLSEGAGVVTTRGDVHYVVTEYGVAYLHGKNIRERVMALINIAHPKFRDELIAVAKEHHYVYHDQILPPESVRYPKELETYKVFSGNLNIFFRPIKPTDERGVQEFFYSLSDKSVRYRFYTIRKGFYHEDIQSWVNIDYTSRMVVAGIVKDERGRDKIIALGQYVVTDELEKIADTGLAIADQYQNMGIGDFSTQYLACVAKEQGIARFTAEVLSENEAMLAILRKHGYKVLRSQGLYYEMSLDLR
jgi:ribosomal protein S18 acetylase RimI-like enzyme/acyl CoA:acetate/3-ketoacid CoA transferase beta subunit